LVGGRQDFAYALDKDEEYNLKVMQARVVAIAKSSAVPRP
jgi:hypothetical protein